jgi:hypothetical protein
MKRLEIKAVTLGFGGLYANLHFTDGSKKEVKAQWYNDNFPQMGDYVDFSDSGDMTLVKPWMIEE